ncbi:MAG: hypothetical protein Q7K43_05295 [Candidatus Woesearchaeota archaeon]|nr:hypothetical protein [Candidatus Woesearchaeota archaeon]
MLIVFTVYAPENSGLKFVREQGLQKISRLNYKVVDVRGENIVELVETAQFPALGITGQDLAPGYLMQKPLNLWRKGPYENSLFGLPALCVLSRKGELIDAVKERLNACNTAEQAREFIREIPRCPKGRIIYTARYAPLLKAIYGWIPEQWKPMTGKADVTAAADQSVDCVIDIVLSGNTAREVGLGIESVLYLSDGVIIANNLAKEVIEQLGGVC